MIAKFQKNLLKFDIGVFFLYNWNDEACVGKNEQAFHISLFIYI